MVDSTSAMQEFLHWNEQRYPNPCIALITEAPALGLEMHFLARSASLARGTFAWWERMVLRNRHAKRTAWRAKTGTHSQGVPVFLRNSLKDARLFASETIT
jgi:hypothetical protein